MTRNALSVALLIGIGAATACAKDKSEPKSAAEPAAPAPAAPPVVEITASDYAFAMRDTIAGGVVTLRLRNTGKELHHVMAFRLPEGKQLKDFMGESAKGEPPRWAVAVGGPNAPPFDGSSENTIASCVALARAGYDVSLAASFRESNTRAPNVFPAP